MSQDIYIRQNLPKFNPAFFLICGNIIKKCFDYYGVVSEKEIKCLDKKNTYFFARYKLYFSECCFDIKDVLFDYSAKDLILYQSIYFSPQKFKHQSKMVFFSTCQSEVPMQINKGSASEIFIL